MRRYYTLEKAVERSYKNKESFNRDNNTSFVRDSLNVMRLFFGLQPKFYYFDRQPEKIKSPEPQSFHRNCDEDSPTEREKKYLQDLLEEDNEVYRW